MKLFKFAPLILGALALPALADSFSGAYDPSHWTLGNVGTLIAPSTPGSATFGGTTSLTLVGSDTSRDDLGCTGGVYGVLSSPCQTQATIGLGGSYTFSWSYLSSDSAGSAGDIFGVIVDGTRFALSDAGSGSAPQGGTKTYTAQSSFGFFLNCTDCTGGSATATVSDFAVAAAVPEPSTYALMLAGVAGIGAWRRTRRSRA